MSSCFSSFDAFYFSISSCCSDLARPTDNTLAFSEDLISSEDMERAFSLD
jgi:hypothetical protein